MSGDTLMTSPPIPIEPDNNLVPSSQYSYVDPAQQTYKIKVVYNDFASSFMMLRHFWQSHQVALRLENFEVTDLDFTEGDNNDEDGNAFTLAYRYRWDRQTFLFAEYNRIESTRPSRTYMEQAVDLTEQQYQLAVRYYF